MDSYTVGELQRAIDGRQEESKQEWRRAALSAWGALRPWIKRKAFAPDDLLGDGREVHRSIEEALAAVEGRAGGAPRPRAGETPVGWPTKEQVRADIAALEKEMNEIAARNRREESEPLVEAHHKLVRDR